MHDGFIDLDELIVRCRDKVSKKFIQEAVACYRAGAYRSCIVSTWNAVVFDFLHKLRELEMFGDAEASRLLQEFENLRSSGNKYQELWQFESKIPDLALDNFELISNIEKSDIERLFKDRSRCAHPSMTSLEEPFEATAELARYHLRSAIIHLLQRPPVQGRKAYQRISQDIKSQYFPVESELALLYLQSSPLARARFILIKDVVIGLTKGLLIENNPENENSRILAALNAVSIMYPKDTLEILNNQLSDIINRVNDENFQKVVIYLGSVSKWNYLSEACRLKLNCFLESLDIFEIPNKFSKEAIFIIKKASNIEFLIPTVINKLQLPVDKLLELIQVSKDDLFKEKIIIPILKESAPNASLIELISMRREGSLRTDKNIQLHITTQISTYSQLELTKILFKQRNVIDEWFILIIESELENKIIPDDIETLLKAKYYYVISISEPKDNIVELFNKALEQQVNEKISTISLSNIFALFKDYEDESFMRLIEPELEDKILGESLTNLLAAKLTYKSINNPENKVLGWFDNAIEQLVNSASITDLLKPDISLEQIPEEVINPILQNNIDAIDAVINNYKNSSSWESAGKNTALLVRIAENLTTAQWTNILESFFKNSELYASFYCPPQIECLFKKSLELNNCVKPYWLSFRKKLDTLTSTNKPINSLKNLIDSHIVEEF